ncbi:MAG: carbohydrate kinase [Dorea sp.]|nr:carbohydrate kinase [Dorea sp.]
MTIDRGQSGIKAAFCSINAKVLKVETCKCEPIRSRYPGWAEQDMDLIWGQTVSLIRKLFENSDIEPKDVAAVSFSGQGGGNFLVSEEGRAVYPGVLSLDNRHEEIADFFSKPGKVPRTIAFMRWLKEKEPEIYGRVRWILGSKDWIRYCLTGKAYADMSDPAVPVDIETGAYQLECIHIAGVPECEKKLPPLVYACEVCGKVTKKAADETGLHAGTLVVAGAHDMIACSLGAGGIRQGHLSVIMGTMGINIGVADKDTRIAESDVSGESFMFGGAVKGTRMITTSIGSGCNTMDFFLDLLFPYELKEAKEQGIGIYELLEKKLCGKKPCQVIFQPYLLGTFYNSSAKAGFLGITMQTTREDLILALFQGICISMCVEIEKLEKKIHKFNDIWLVGGGSRSRIWGQMFADVLKRPVHICDTGEVGCRGAAICAGIALGYYTTEQDFPKPRPAVIYKPDTRYAGDYERQIEKYKKAYEAGVSIWKM